MSERWRFGLMTVAALLALAATLMLGRWQLGRAAEKVALQQRIEAMAREPVLGNQALLALPDLAASVHRQTELRGHWVTDRTIFLDNRQMNAKPGYFVLTPLMIDTSHAVLVQRGWVARNFLDRSQLPAIATPSQEVVIQGRIAPPPSKLYELGLADSGPIRQNLDLAAFRLETGLDLMALSVLQTDGAGDGLLRDWPVAKTGVDKHYGYAFQWFGLAALIAVLYVWFQIVRRFKTARQP